MITNFTPCEGGCACGYVRYTISSPPFIIHCCHCRFCQRQTGSAFALNALFDATSVNIIAGEVKEVMTPSPSGRGQVIARCPRCEVAIWSNYFMGGIKNLIRFIRVGTLDEAALFPPDVHIYTESKQPWLQLAKNSPQYEKFYDFKAVWSKENEAKRQSLLTKAIGDK
ncbi:GFA family protein [Litorilituus lipolyticus]|uniref:GFA family protein n=1 Tax=Litorilituus lipolyticus TaxID=2491017 RepID=A0A502KQC6_9GAMM|nr:GFA family protein [Litorilituus lipolyticus]TPH12499.1 GFA family protein [Litorilituus lipolyticus]